ncbi:hypothetical protein Y032_0163g3457 [Ancylostoma ceylanicum]|uniref:Uncharacterized protein n=1 Tax=Ancylostoma ceylanicum TaxID=53326 RepID=A0A016SXR1_9BILA|nr:hypothetical protein Y032_0163g3457 [Ancylostoma ceylanicum]
MVIKVDYTRSTSKFFHIFLLKPADRWLKMTKITHSSFPRLGAAIVDTVLCLPKCLLFMKWIVTDQT